MTNNFNKNKEMEINDKYGLDDQYNIQDFHKERGKNKNNYDYYDEYCWFHHSLIEIKDQNEGSLAVGIGINPKTNSKEQNNDKEQDNDQTSAKKNKLENTRSRSIYAIQELDPKLKDYLQFDLSNVPTDKASEVKKIENESIETLKKGLNELHDSIKYVLIAWGRKGQDFLNKKKNKNFREELHDILEPYLKEEKLYMFFRQEGLSKTTCPYQPTASIKNKKLCLMNKNAFLKFLG